MKFRSAPSIVLGGRRDRPGARTTALGRIDSDPTAHAELLADAHGLSAR